MASRSQRAIDLDAFNTLPRPKAMSTGASESLQTDAILSSQEPVPAASNPKNPPAPTKLIPSTIYKPAVLHPPHSLSKIGQSGHWVPYPLGLMPYDSWYKLHHSNGGDIQPKPALSCPVCGGKREMTAHIHKLFLVAERLTWEDGLLSAHEKELNANLNLKINNELGIQRSIVNNPVHLPRAKDSKMNKLHPYYNEHEMMLAFELLSTTESLTEASWSLWLGMQLYAEKIWGAGETTGSLSSETMAGEHMRAPNTTSHDCVSERPRHTSGLLTPPLSSEKEPVRGNASLKTSTTPVLPIHAAISAMQHSHSATNATTSSSRSNRIVSYRSLQDFYTLLDQIERTSYAGALFLEAYAERLRDDMCKDCWFAHNVRLDVF
jgi:hypothetical protein